MKLKSLLIVLAVLLMGMKLMAERSVSFLHNGSSINGVIIDISSRTGQIDFLNNTRIHRSNVWMINFGNNRWNFPAERAQLSKNTDTIFLRDGRILYVRINDFSIKKRTFEFPGGGKVHESNVLRIYFCCTTLPAAYSGRY